MTISDAELRKTAKQFFLQTPADLSQGYVKWAEDLQAYKGLDYGCVLDNHLIPLHPGDLMAVVARPGHGKSSWMAYMAKRAADDIIRREVDNEVVVYVTWEQTAEEVEAFFQSAGDYSVTDMAWGKADINLIKRKSLARAGIPIWIFGESKRHEGRKRPRMTIEYVYASIESMFEDYGVKPILMCLDYVQIMPINWGDDKTARVDEAIRQAKDLAIRMGLPVIIGVQAARRVDNYTNQIPVMSDAQWSSAIEQVADKQLALWRPIRNKHPDEHPSIQVGQENYANDEDLFVIRLLKQRFGIGHGVWAVRFKPDTLDIYDYTKQEIEYSSNGGYAELDF